MKLGTYISSLRRFRVWHRFVGISLAILFFISAITGILLALKKEFNTIQPSTQKGLDNSLTNWKPIKELANLASAELYKTHPNQKGNPIDRIDVRPSKGIAKVLFKNAQWEVQIDGSTGEVKSIARRHSDWIEALHDGSIISYGFKLVTMNVLGIGLLLLISTGLWMWYAPKKVRQTRKARSGED